MGLFKFNERLSPFFVASSSADTDSSSDESFSDSVIIGFVGLAFIDVEDIAVDDVDGEDEDGTAFNVEWSPSETDVVEGDVEVCVVLASI